MPKENIYPEDVRDPGISVHWDRGQYAIDICMYDRKTRFEEASLDRLITVLKRAQRHMTTKN